MTSQPASQDLPLSVEKTSLRTGTKKARFIIGRFFVGADSGNRTCDLFITSELLYQLSHVGASNNIDNPPPFIKKKKAGRVRFCGAFPR